MKIFLDTNFLMIPVKFGVDIFSEMDRIIDEKYELVTVEPVVKELEFISQGRGKDAKAAKVGLELIKRKKIKVVKTKEKSADKSLIELSEGNAVATLDVELKKKLMKIGRKVIYLRAKKYLVLG